MILKDVTVIYKKLSLMQEEFRAERSNVKARMCRKFIAMLEFTPTIEAEPVIHAHWIPKYVSNGMTDLFECSNCSARACVEIMSDRCYFKRCRNCGAWMDGKED